MSHLKTKKTIQKHRKQDKRTSVGFVHFNVGDSVDRVDVPDGQNLVVVVRWFDVLVLLPRLYSCLKKINTKNLPTI